MLVIVTSRAREKASMKSSAAGGSARPLLVTADPDLLDDLLRLAAAAGVELAVVPDLVAARTLWPTAPLVLLGDDAARSAGGGLARGRTPRRHNVVLVVRDGGDAEVWQRAIAVGADQVCLLPEAESSIVEALGRCTAQAVQPAAVVAVIGGRGGAGASTLAAALAVTAARANDRVTFIDADPLGGGADLLFAGETAAGARWSDLAATQGRIPPPALRDALPQVSGLAVLSWDQPSGGPLLDVGPEAMTSVLDAAARGGDLVVVDLPRRLDPTTRAVVGVADVTLVVVPAEVRGAAAAARVAAAIAPVASDARLVVRGPAPGGLRATDIAAAVGLPLAGELRAEPGLAGGLERGEAPAGRGVGPLARLCVRLLDQLPAWPERPAEARWPA
jgi:secretion/DNA translocation related CpaE-like protein